MKKQVEITIKELHVGSCKTVVSMQIGANTEVDEFLDQMIKSNPSTMKSLKSAMATICSEENYVNKRKYRSTSEAGIYEIKTGSIRLYCFQDRLSDDLACLIIATNGSNKNTKKEQNRDIKRAAKIRNEYLVAKKSDDTILNYQTKHNEN